MHQHGRGIALQLSHFAVGYGGCRTYGIALFPGDVGRSQAHNEVFNQLPKISSALLVAKRNASKIFALFDLRQPIYDDFASATLQYRRHSLLLRPDSRFASEHLLAKQVDEFRSFEWFHDDFIRFQKDSGHSTLHIGVSAD